MRTKRACHAPEPQNQFRQCHTGGRSSIPANSAYLEPIGGCLRKSLYDTYLLVCCNMSIIVENAKKGTGGKIITSNFYGFMLTSVYATSLGKNYLLFSELVCTGNEIWQSIQRSDNNNKELFLKIFVSFFVNTYSKNQKISLHPCLNTPIV